VPIARGLLRNRLIGDVPMDGRDRITIARILKVNHAGEYGAIRIYRAQLRLARRLYPDLVDFLEETLVTRSSTARCSARPCLSGMRGHAA
jgi:ubiquinone biosynthesis monooxygenase Coq7